MNSTQRVKNTITGKGADRTPVYGWVSANMTNQISAVYGNVAAFEDKYEFDMSHIFGGPGTYDGNVLEQIRAKQELTPDILLDVAQLSPDNMADYAGIVNGLRHHKLRDRFCYVQTPGLFEHFNGVFGIENQLCYLAEYPDEIAELYKRQAEWNIRFAKNCVELGVDMVHISDDWGAQNDLMFSPRMWREYIFPNMKKVVDSVHKAGCFVSLHSDGCVVPVLCGIKDLGIDAFHPWQESAGMPYSLWLDNYCNDFAILGGICIQTTLGFGNLPRLESEIRRIFGLLRGKKWMCCTTHFVQDHCSMEELEFAFKLILDLR